MTGDTAGFGDLNRKARRWRIFLRKTVRQEMTRQVERMARDLDHQASEWRRGGQECEQLQQDPE